MGNLIRVPIGGWGIGQEDDVIFTVVGSCVAIMLFDKKTNVGGMIHIMLGYSKGRDDNPTKYVDTGIPFLIDRMVKKGAAQHRLKGCKISGGGEMFEVTTPEVNVSRNNVIATYEVLQKMGIRIISADTGGKTGRRVAFFIESGKAKVEMQGRQNKLL